MTPSLTFLGAAGTVTGAKFLLEAEGARVLRRSSSRTLRLSGHILGASIVQLIAGGRRLVYSGDLGRYDAPVMRDPDVVERADTLLVESTYGNRVHPRDDDTPVIEAASRAAAGGGSSSTQYG